MPPPVVALGTLRVNIVEELPDVEEVPFIVALPALGVPEHGFAPLPVTGVLTEQAIPPPDIVMLPV